MAFPFETSRFTSPVCALLLLRLVEANPPTAMPAGSPTETTHAQSATSRSNFTL